MSWAPDWNTLSDIGTVSAVAISIAAIIISQRGQSAQQLREKKEELRGVLERLVLLREQDHVITKEKDDALRASARAFLNIKRCIYLEAAESIVDSIPGHVTGSEYWAIGYENHMDSDFVHSQKYYELAAKHADTSSPTKKSEILRSLAWTYFSNDQKFRNYNKGRAAFSSAIDALATMNDHYSLYVRMLGYRNWAAAELGIGNREEASRLLSIAYAECLKIPTSTAVGWLNSDLRQIAHDWTYIAASYFQAKAQSSDNIKKGRSAFAEGEKVLGTLFDLCDTYGISNDYGIDALCTLLQAHAEQEHAAGFREEGQRLLAQAEQQSLRLSDDFQWKSFRMAELKKAQVRMASGQPHPSPLPPAVPGAVGPPSDRELDLVGRSRTGERPEDLIREAGASGRNRPN